MKEMNLRYIARVMVEAATPLAVGSGEKSLVTDRLVARDISGLPYIRGTSVTGVLRNMVAEELDKSEVGQWDKIFGFQKQDEANSGQGSRLIVSSAYFVGKGGTVFEGVGVPDWKDPFYGAYRKLPVRDHVRIGHKGTAEDGGKFDEEVVYKGTRFVFELELIGNKDDLQLWDTLLMTLRRKDFRLGGGTRKGFGELEIISIIQRCYDLSAEADLHSYLAKSSSLKQKFEGSTFLIEPEADHYTYYQLKLRPDSFFLFGSASGSDDADMIAATETIVVWNNNQPTLHHDQLLIPGTSVKGALAHRVAFHSNKQRGVHAGMMKNGGELLGHLLKQGYLVSEIDNFDSSKQEDLAKLLTLYNPDVVDLFGFSVNSRDENLVSIKDKKRGRVMISDLFDASKSRKVLNHVAIDRFTGGAIDGALFTEEVATTSGILELDVVVKNVTSNNSGSTNAIEALEAALKDIASGLLPLGGGVMRGNGCFTGQIIKNGELMYEYQL